MRPAEPHRLHRPVPVLAIKKPPADPLGEGGKSRRLGLFCPGGLCIRVLPATRPGVQKAGARAILSSGSWVKNDMTITPVRLVAGVLPAQKGGMQDIWITPSLLMTDALWAVFPIVWGNPESFEREVFDYDETGNNRRMGKTTLSDLNL